MIKQSRYRIIKHKTIEGLDSKVNAMLAQGFVVVGGIECKVVSEKLTMFYQAVVMEEEQMQAVITVPDNDPNISRTT